MVMPQSLAPADFEPHLGSDFAVASAPEGSSSLKLASLERHAQSNSPRAEPFTLVFVSELVLDQRIHELHHPELGAMQIFLVPIGPDPSGQLRYEAIFN